MERLSQRHQAQEPTLQLRFATLQTAGWHLAETGASERVGQGVYLFVSGVESKIHGSGHIWCFLSRSGYLEPLAEEGAGKEEVICP